ncbi:hypothetical protein J7394_11625 [Ruegeria sp. R13_0]|nr:hypothetical protein [Ruegeria sp. R13_0]
MKFCLTAAGEADANPQYNPTLERDTIASQVVLASVGGRVTNPSKGRTAFWEDVLTKLLLHHLVQLDHS